MELAALSAHKRLVLRAALDSRAKAAEHIQASTDCICVYEVAMQGLDAAIQKVACIEALMSGNPKWDPQDWEDYEEAAHLILSLARKGR